MTPFGDPANDHHQLMTERQQAAMQAIETIRRSCWDIGDDLREIQRLAADALDAIDDDQASLPLLDIKDAAEAALRKIGTIG